MGISKKRATSRGKKLLVPNKAALPILLIIVIAAVLSLATLLSFSSTSAIITNSSVNEAHSNAQIQASDMSKIVSNKLADVVDNVQVISASPVIASGDVNMIDEVLKTAQDSTRDFTTTYSWVNSAGSPAANSNATILAAAQKAGLNVSQQQYFLKPNVTGKQYLIIAQPSYDRQLVNGNEEGVFIGVVTASVSLTSIGQYVQTQLSSHFPGTVGLLDPTGVILYSANESFVGANVFGAQFRASLPSAFKQPFYSMINQSLKGSTGFQDFSLNGASGTFAYQPVSVSINGRNQTYAREAAILFVGLPHVLAADQAAQIAL